MALVDRSTGWGRSAPATGSGLVLASRGDALTPYLFEALARRYPISGQLHPDLGRAQRLAVAASTFHPSRRRWAEQFYKSGQAYRMRTANAARQRSRLARGTDPVLQVHALFEVPDATSVLYLDCTHAQSVRHWPQWNPLRGKALDDWYRRETLAYRTATHLFAFSRQTRDSLLHDYGIAPAKVSVVGAGVNLHRLPGPPRRATPAAPTVLFIGNDFVRKGGPVLLQAFRQVRHRLPQARLQLVGTDPGLPGEPGVQVLGRIHDRTRISRLYQQASVFCLPSFFDPLPLVLLEAMAHGLPVVSTASCGIPDVVTDGDTGRLVAAGDPDALAETLLALLTAPVAAAGLGARGYERVRAGFTWDAVVDRMALALDPLVSG